MNINTLFKWMLPSLLLVALTGCAEMPKLELPDFARSFVDTVRGPFESESASGPRSDEATLPEDASVTSYSALGPVVAATDSSESPGQLSPAEERTAGTSRPMEAVVASDPNPAEGHLSAEDVALARPDESGAPIMEAGIDPILFLGNSLVNLLGVFGTLSCSSLAAAGPFAMSAACGAVLAVGAIAVFADAIMRRGGIWTQKDYLQETSSEASGTSSREAERLAAFKVGKEPRAASTPARDSATAGPYDVVSLKIAVLPYAGYAAFDGLAYGSPERIPVTYFPEIKSAISNRFPGSTVIALREHEHSDNPLSDSTNIWSQKSPSEYHPNLSAILSEARKQSIDLLIGVFWDAVLHGSPRVTSTRVFVIGIRDGTIVDEVANGDTVQPALDNLLTTHLLEEQGYLAAAGVSAPAATRPTPNEQFDSIRPGDGVGATPSSGPYKVAIFPMFGGGTLTRCVAARSQLGRELTAHFKQDKTFDVKHSAFPHDAHEQISQEYIWSERGKPNYDVVYSTASRYNVDVAIMTSMDCSGKSGAIPTRLYMVDVQLRKTYSADGYASKVSRMLEDANAQYEKGRYVAQSFSKTGRNE